MLVNDKQGNPLTKEKEQEIRWNEHFQEMLNRPPPDEEMLKKIYLLKRRASPPPSP